MKKIVFLSTFILQLQFLYSQNLTFKVEEGEMHLPISNAKICTTKFPKIITYSNDSGYFHLKVNHSDTLLIEKVNYHPIFINVSHSNFDTTHFITVNMASLKKGETGSKELHNLQSFEYHFVHDTLGEDSHVKLHVFEGYNSSGRRVANKNQSFNIVDVKFGDTSGHPREEKKSSYVLKK